MHFKTPGVSRFELDVEGLIDCLLHTCDTKRHIKREREKERKGEINRERERERESVT